MDEAPVHFSSQALRTADQPISYFMRQAVENPNLISLAAGLVDPESLPVAETAAAFERIARRGRGRAALQYGTTQGLAGLREKLLMRTAALDGVTPREISLSPEEVVVTTGSQQLLYLISQVLLDPVQPPPDEHRPPQVGQGLIPSCASELAPDSLLTLTPQSLIPGGGEQADRN